jgi:hypothetical protein
MYPAVVVRSDGVQAFIVYWEGDSAIVAPGDLRPMSYGPGQRVAANYQNQNQYWPGVVQRTLGGAVEVLLDNGQAVWTTWAKCRVPR